VDRRTIVDCTFRLLLLLLFLPLSAYRPTSFWLFLFRKSRGSAGKTEKTEKRRKAKEMTEEPGAILGQLQPIYRVQRKLFGLGFGLVLGHVNGVTTATPTRFAPVLQLRLLWQNAKLINLGVKSGRISRSLSLMGHKVPVPIPVPVPIYHPPPL